VKTIPFILTVSLLAVVAGCQNNGNKPTPAEQINTLKQENIRIARQVEQLKKENKRLEDRCDVLSGLPEQVKGQNLYRLKTIKITRYTNLYDKDKDGQYEKLIVYIQPIDEDGDIIKAAGAVDVQLWDLNKEQSQALLGQWRVSRSELKKLWFATLIIINYRLTFDVADKIDKFDEPLTVKVTFTDYLSGRVFKEQKVIEPPPS